MDDTKYINIIEKNMKELKKTMDILQELTNYQSESFETIENFIELSKKESIKGNNELIEASKFEESSYKYYISYVIGGLSLITMFFYM